VAWVGIHSGPRQPAVSTSAQLAAVAREKQGSFERARAQAARDHRPVVVAQTFTDAELSSLAEEQVKARQLPFDRVALRATAEHTVVGSGVAHVGGQSVPLSLVAVPEVVGGNNLQLRVVDVQLGALPLPGPVADNLTATIRQSLSLGRIEGFQSLEVSVSAGRITVKGVAFQG